MRTSNFGPYGRAGQNKRQKGKIFETVAEAEKALQARRRIYGDGSPEVYNGIIELASYCVDLAEKKFNSGDDHMSVALVEKALELTAGSWSAATPPNVLTVRVEALAAMAKHHERRGEFGKARSCYERAIKVESRLPEGVSPTSHLGLANVLSRLSRHDDATTHATAAALLARQDLEGLPPGDSRALAHRTLLRQALTVADEQGIMSEDSGEDSFGHSSTPPKSSSHRRALSPLVARPFSPPPGRATSLGFSPPSRRGSPTRRTNKEYSGKRRISGGGGQQWEMLATRGSPNRGFGQRHVATHSSPARDLFWEEVDSAAARGPPSRRPPTLRQRSTEELSPLVRSTEDPRLMERREARKATSDAEKRAVAGNGVAVAEKEKGKEAASEARKGQDEEAAGTATNDLERKSCGWCTLDLPKNANFCYICGRAVSAEGRTRRKSSVSIATNPEMHVYAYTEPKEKSDVPPIYVVEEEEEGEGDGIAPLESMGYSLTAGGRRTNRRQSVWDAVSPPSAVAAGVPPADDEHLPAPPTPSSDNVAQGSKTSPPQGSDSRRGSLAASRNRSSGSLSAHLRDAELAAVQHSDHTVDQSSLLWKVGSLLSSAVTVYENMDFNLASERILSEALMLCDAQLASIFLVDEARKVCTCSLIHGEGVNSRHGPCRDAGCECSQFTEMEGKRDTSDDKSDDKCANCKHTRKQHKVDVSIPYPRGLVWKVVETGELVNVQHADEESTFREGRDSPFSDAVVPRNILAMPLKARSGRVVAVIEVVNKTQSKKRSDSIDEGFDHIDEFLLSSLAGLAGIALRNSRLYEVSVLARSNMNAVLDVAKSLASTMDIGALCQKIMASVRDLLCADRCTLFLLDKKTGELWSKVAQGTTEIRFSSKIGIAGHVATTKDVLNIPVASEDPRFNDAIDRKTGYKTKTILCMPLCNRDGEVLGVTQVINKLASPAFTDDDIQLLEAFSAQAAVAIQNSAMFQELQEMSNLMQSILRSISNLVITFDMTGKLVSTNKEDMRKFIGEDEEVMRKQSYHEWMDSRNEQLLDDMEFILKGGDQLLVSEYQYYPQGAEVMSINYNLYPLLDFKRVQKGIVMVVEDVSNEKRLFNTMSRYMSPALASQVLSDGGPQLGGSRLWVTVVFCDIRSFTTLSEGLEPQQVVELLNEYFSLMVNVILENNGVLDKYIGDALMAVFGVPFVNKDDSHRACLSIIRMRELLAKFNEERRKAGKFEISNGIGVSTGHVLCGNIGSERRLEYTVIGDTVNLASRLEGITKVYKVNAVVTESTYEEVKDNFVFRCLDSVRVLGRTQPVVLYELVAEKEEDVDPRFLEAMPLFEEARQHYMKQEWDRAIATFERVHGMCEDKTAKVFVQRCLDFQKEPPGPDWDGVWVADSK